ncbi:MAG TPA: aldo/keto reductase [Candidatus Sulfotelmatobacter sp.]|nr:aldo/keto reductase [Candidatus Sulfotelmatobacter sp.]
MGLTDYTTLGRSGLRVSPLCLGTMTFGTEWGWGADESISRSIFDRYLEAGGNFVDTADGYTGGKSEEMVGKFIADRKSRDKVVLATKFTFNTDPSNPNAGGNGRKNIYRALESSLRRLQTDFIDLYWLHAWDRITPVEEVISTLNDLVRQGKIRHYGFSDTPAWYVARAYTLAEKSAQEHLIALQLEYSLVERNIEREHIPAAQEFGLGVCPWSPLASGFLSGKYRRDAEGSSDGRLEKVKDSGNPGFQKFTEQNWKILDVLLEVSREIGRPPAQIALNWVATQPGITSTILGASKLTQLNDNLSSLEFTIPAELRRRLDDVSAPASIHPYVFFEPFIQNMIHGASPVSRWNAGQRISGAVGMSEPKEAEVASHGVK